MQKRNAELVRNLTPDFVRRGDPITLSYSTDNVSNPPTEAELDAAFDESPNLPEPFAAIVNDGGANITIWFVVSVNGNWYYEQLTLAV